jgi:hypothetical protein
MSKKMRVMASAIFVAFLFSFLFIMPGLEGGGGAKPAVWKAVIPYDSLNLTGVGVPDPVKGWVYDDRVTGVDVYATIGKPYRMIFRMILFPPNQLAFINIQPGELHTDGDLKFSRFPPILGTDLFGFLLNSHPYDAQYLRAQIAFFGPDVSTQQEANWENMWIGEVRAVRMWFSLEANNMYGDCSECSPEDYHSLEGNTYDAWITRESLDTWTATVVTDFLNMPVPPDQAPPFDLSAISYSTRDFLREIYCECVQSKVKNRTFYEKLTRYPAWGRTHLEFKIKFIKAS